MLRDRDVTVLVKSDGQDALKQVIPKTAGKAGLPYGPALVERHEARHLPELLQAVIEDASACGHAFLVWTLK